jgi:hypothetical protein
MENFYLIGLQHGEVIGILSYILIILCFYFTLTFFHSLKSNDERVITQSKIAAVICLSLGLLIPLLNSLY